MAEIAYKHNQLFSEKDIISNFDNFHVIPFSDYVTLKLKDISKGDIVNVKGYLVDLDCHMLPFVRNTSLSFTDRSATSCEQILIEEINTLE